MSDEMRIKIRLRSRPPTPLKWEIHVGKRLVTASNTSYATQGQAHDAGKAALNGIVLDSAKNLKDGK